MASAKWLMHRGLNLEAAPKVHVPLAQCTRTTAWAIKLKALQARSREGLLFWTMKGSVQFTWVIKLTHQSEQFISAYTQSKKVEAAGKEQEGIAFWTMKGSVA